MEPGAADSTGPFPSFQILGVNVDPGDREAQPKRSRGTVLPPVQGRMATLRDRMLVGGFR